MYMHNVQAINAPHAEGRCERSTTIVPADLKLACMRLLVLAIAAFMLTIVVHLEDFLPVKNQKDRDL